MIKTELILKLADRKEKSIEEITRDLAPWNAKFAAQMQGRRDRAKARRDAKKQVKLAFAKKWNLTQG